jgi:hypothetical protein
MGLPAAFARVWLVLSGDDAMTLWLIIAWLYFTGFFGMAALHFDTENEAMTDWREWAFLAVWPVGFWFAAIRGVYDEARGR